MTKVAKPSPPCSFEQLNPASSYERGSTLRGLTTAHSTQQLITPKHFLAKKHNTMSDPHPPSPNVSDENSSPTERATMVWRHQQAVAQREENHEHDPTTPLPSASERRFSHMSEYSDRPSTFCDNREMHWNWWSKNVKDCGPQWHYSSGQTDPIENLTVRACWDNVNAPQRSRKYMSSSIVTSFLVKRSNEECGSQGRWSSKRGWHVKIQSTGGQHLL